MCSLIESGEHCGDRRVLVMMLGVGRGDGGAGERWC